MNTQFSYTFQAPCVQRSKTTEPHQKVRRSTPASLHAPSHNSHNQFSPTSIRFPLREPTDSSNIYHRLPDSTGHRPSSAKCSSSTHMFVATDTWRIVNMRADHKISNIWQPAATQRHLAIVLTVGFVVQTIKNG